uniref:Uncharacterized protein n=1 Tax=Romanomermis culicivorax TaxID=13658 RepID=A0A915K7W6_ROMCU
MLATMQNFGSTLVKLKSSLTTARPALCSNWKPRTLQFLNLGVHPSIS